MTKTSVTQPSGQCDTPSIEALTPDKLNQEYAAWLQAKVSPELLTEPKDVFVPMRPRNPWKHCLEFVRILGLPYEVISDWSSDEGSTLSVARPTLRGSSPADCPNCIDDTRFDYQMLNGEPWIVCETCDSQWPIQQGVPSEHQDGAK